MLYNKRDTLFYKTAARLKIATANIIDSLYQLPTIRRDTGDESGFSEEHAVGNLEAELDTLKLLISDDDFKDETRLVLNADPITSLLRIEQPVYKPSPPTPPPTIPLKVPKPKKEKQPRGEKPKRDYKLERQRRKEAHAALAADTAALLNTTPGFRAPRSTRSSNVPLVNMDISLLTQPARWSTSTNLVDERSEIQAEASQMPPTAAVEGEEPVTPSVKPRSWRREHLVLPGQGVPNMVESMDDIDSFKNFDRGWILTSGSRRHGRVGQESVSRDTQPPKKRQRLGRFLFLIRTNSSLMVYRPG